MGPASMLRVAVLGLGCVLGCAESHQVEVDAALPVDSGVDSGRREMDAGLRCGADEFVWNSICRPCPSGSSNEAGDDPTGPNTQCDDACTAIDGIACSTYLKGNVPNPGNGFGTTVEIDGNLMVVADHQLIHTFQREGNRWEYVSGFANHHRFVELSEGRLLVGNLLYEHLGNSWELYGAVSPPAGVDHGQLYGHISGDRIIIASPFESSDGRGVNPTLNGNRRPESGAAYIFRFQDRRLVPEAMLKASNPETGDQFGVHVAIDGDNAVVTSQTQTYFFHRNDGGWVEEAVVAGRVHGPGKIAIDGDTVVIPSREPNSVGTVYERNAGSWDAFALPDHRSFNASVHEAALDGDTLVIGVVDFMGGQGLNPPPGEQVGGAGGALIFQRQGERWERIHVLRPDVNENDVSGTAVAISGDTIAIGAPNEAGSGVLFDGDPFDNSRPNAGAVWLRRIPGLTR